MPFTGLQISQPAVSLMSTMKIYSGDGNDDDSSVAGVDDDDDDEDL